MYTHIHTSFIFLSLILLGYISSFCITVYVSLVFSVIIRRIHPLNVDIPIVLLVVASMETTCYIGGR